METRWKRGGKGDFGFLIEPLPPRHRHNGLRRLLALPVSATLWADSRWLGASSRSADKAATGRMGAQVSTYIDQMVAAGAGMERVRKAVARSAPPRGSRP